MNKTLIHSLKKSYPKVTLIMASKYLEASQLKAYYLQGIKHFGENRVEMFLGKKAEFKEAVTWHFIGTLQTKKVKKVINEIDVLHTIDRIKLMEEIQKYRIKPLKAFIQFNISNEENKHGFLENDIEAIIHALKMHPIIEPIGVMGMAEHSSDETIIRNQFEALINLKNLLNQAFPSSKNLSMGMSDDYKIALDLNTTHLRLGRILLEETC